MSKVKDGFYKHFGDNVGNNTLMLLAGGDVARIPSTVYNYANGCLVKTDIAYDTDTMVTFRIEGNSYTGSKYSMLTTGLFYNYYNGGNHSIIHGTMMHHGSEFGNVSVFCYEGYVHLWFKQKVNFQSFIIEVYATNSDKPGVNRVVSITNSAKPSLTNLVHKEISSIDKYISLVPKQFLQYNQGYWLKILLFTTPTDSISSSISFTWHPSECNRNIWADFNINVRYDVNSKTTNIIFVVNWKGTGTKILKCVKSSNDTYSVWVLGPKNGYDPYGAIQVTSTYEITNYLSGSLAYQDSDPGGTSAILGGVAANIHNYYAIKGRIGSNNFDWNNQINIGTYKIQPETASTIITNHPTYKDYAKNSNNEFGHDLYAYLYGLAMILKGLVNDTEDRTTLLYFPHSSHGNIPLYIRMKNTNWTKWYGIPSVDATFLRKKIDTSDTTKTYEFNANNLINSDTIYSPTSDLNSVNKTWTNFPTTQAPQGGFSLTNIVEGYYRRLYYSGYNDDRLYTRCLKYDGNTKTIVWNGWRKFGLTSDYEEGYAMTKYTIDASTLESNKYYPVTIDVGKHANVRIEIRVALNSNSPSWGTHSSKCFSVRKIWETNGSGYGTNPVNRRIFVSDYTWTDTDPVTNIGLMTQSSNEYVYVRGGGKYYFYISHNKVPILHSSSFTSTGETIDVIDKTNTIPIIQSLYNNYWANVKISKVSNSYTDPKFREVSLAVGTDTNANSPKLWLGSYHPTKQTDGSFTYYGSYILALGGRTYGNHTISFFTKYSQDYTTAPVERVRITAEGDLSILGGNIHLTLTGSLIQTQLEGSNYTTAVEWYRTNVTNSTDTTSDFYRPPQIGHYNKGDVVNDSSGNEDKKQSGSIILLPYHTPESFKPWEGTKGLRISKSKLTWENHNIFHQGNVNRENALLFAPISSGSKGQILTSNTNSAPTWSSVRCLSFSFEDNGGYDSWLLISDLSTWCTPNNKKFGLVGTIFGQRDGNQSLTGVYDIVAFCSSWSTGIMCKLYNVNKVANTISPYIVTYNNKKYLALRKTGSGSTVYFIGYAVNIDSSISVYQEKLNLPSSITINYSPTFDQHSITTNTLYNGTGTYNILHSGNYEQYICPFTYTSDITYTHATKKFTVTKSANSWVSHAYSNFKYSVPCSLTYTIDKTNVDALIGLNSNSPLDEYDSLDYAIRHISKKILIWEGASRYTYDRDYSANDLFKIEFDGSKVRYYHNNILFRTSDGPALETKLLADIFLYQPNLSVSNVEFSQSPISVDKLDNYHRYLISSVPNSNYDLIADTTPMMVDGISLGDMYLVTAPDNSSPFGKVWYTESYSSYYSDWMYFTPGETICIDTWIMRGSSSGTSGLFYLGIEFVDKNGKVINSNNGCDYPRGLGGITPTVGTWTKKYVEYTIPKTHDVYNGSDGGALYKGRVRVLVNYEHGTNPTYFGGYRIYRMHIPDYLERRYVNVTGDTMTGKLTLMSGTYTDDGVTGALDLANSNIVKVNGIYFADEAADATEGINFYRTTTTADTIWAKSGVLYFTPNRTYGSAGTNYTVWHEGNKSTRTFTGTVNTSYNSTFTGRLTSDGYTFGNNCSLSVKTAGWYRFGTLSTYDNVGANAILFIRRAYNNNNNESYVISVNIVNDKCYFTQLSGAVNTQLITKLRCVGNYASNGTLYFDFYHKGSTNSDAIYVNCLGNMYVQDPVSTTTTVTSPNKEEVFILAKTTGSKLHDLVINANSTGRYCELKAGELKFCVPNTNAYAMGITYYNNSGGTCLGQIAAYGTNNSVSYYYMGTSYDNWKFKFTSDGKLYATAYYESSDRRLKDNILLLSSDILNKVYDVNEVSFNWKNTGEKSIGYIAQEYENISDIFVSKNEKGILSLNYTEVLVAQIAALKQKISDLENKINNINVNNF